MSSENPIEAGPLLRTVHTPGDLRRLSIPELLKLAEEVRSYLIRHASEFGGHFAASMGVVELTIALHRVFRTPDDLLVWDVGHQAYAHKILTGRREKFHTNRQKNGIAGFPKREESIYDTFGVGHSSTSISAAVGMAEAIKHQQLTHKKVIAVIGDGALTAGLAFEGLNNAGALKSDLLVILNDNNISIDPNVGALREYLTDLTASRTYNRLRDEVWKLLGKIKSLAPKLRSYAAHFEDIFTFLLSRPALLFEALGFRYFGPIDGHDLPRLLTVLEDLRELQGPRLLHVLTTKGKGFAPAEKDQITWHAPAFRFDPASGEPLQASSTPTPPKYQDVFGETLIELAQQNPRIVAITPAMVSGSGLTKMKALMPDRCYDVGIAEQHAVTFSAGLATQGMIPFCAIYSTFMQRAYDQVIHDVAIQKLPVIFCLDRAGAVGNDGATHQGLYDIAYMRCIPNLIVSAPLNEPELRNLMYTAVDTDRPFVIRYPRGQGVTLNWRTPMQKIPIGKGQRLQEGEEVAILSYGTAGNLVLSALSEIQAKGFFPSLYDLRFVKPLDEEMLHYIATHYRALITVEDGCLMGGMGSAILEWLHDHFYLIPTRRLGCPDIVVEHASQKEQYALCGYDEKSIAQTVIETFEKLPLLRKNSF
ncbi:MAG: 1-deoxy-D-xylulose-5-phosphate synthase [Bacteroidia bacterium]